MGRRGASDGSRDSASYFRRAFTTQLKVVEGESSTLEAGILTLEDDDGVLRKQLGVQETDRAAELEDLKSRLMIAEEKASPQDESEVLRQHEGRIALLEVTVRALQVGQAMVKGEIQMHAEARMKAEEPKVLSEALEFQDTEPVFLL